MKVFPETPIPNFPFRMTPEWSTLTSTFENGNEQRRSKWARPKYNITLNYTALKEADSQLLWEFYMSVKGAYEAFLFFDFYVYSHVDHYVGTGDGSTTIFDIPGKSTSSQTLYINGNVITTGFSYLVGGGDGDADRVSFTTAPAVGQTISIDFTGFLRVKCRFLNDKLSRENFIHILMEYGIELKGL